MPTLESYLPETRIFALHISRSGDGKSAAAASYPRPFHEIDYDGRFDGVWAAVKPQGFLEPEGITYDRLYTKDGYEPMQDFLDKLEVARMNGRLPFKTIELASMTSFMQALITSSHKLQKGKMIGKLRMSGPGDFNFEVTGMKQLVDQLSSLPCHVVVSAHIIDKWGKPKTGKAGEEFAQNEVVGEKLNLRDQPGEVLLSMFSNVFRFSREVQGNTMKYYVDFASDTAKNAFGIPPGLHDITGKAFYPYLQDLIQKIRSGSYVAPVLSNSGLNF